MNLIQGGAFSNDNLQVELRLLVPEDHVGELPPYHYRRENMPPWEHKDSIKLTIVDGIERKLI